MNEAHVEKKQIIVSAGLHDRNWYPVNCDLGAGWETCRLINQDDGREVPCQAEGGRLFWIIENLAAGQKRTFLASRAAASDFPKVDIVKKDGALDIKLGGQLFSTYHFSRSVVRPFLNPVMGPAGVSVVRELFEKPNPPDHDHLHHRGLLTAHGAVNGMDNWSEDANHGFIRHEGFEQLVSGAVFGKIVARNSWVSPTDARLLGETRTMIFYNQLPARIIDFEISFTADAGKVVLGDTKEGGLIAIRVATTMRADRLGRFENAYGAINQNECWGKRSPWCDYSGPVGGGRTGIAIFDKLSNPWYPAHWHIRDYGLMAVNPFALSRYSRGKADGTCAIEAGQQLSFGFRVYIHDGDTKEGRVADAFNNYVNPAQVEVVP